MLAPVIVVADDPLEGVVVLVVGDAVSSDSGPISKLCCGVSALTTCCR